MCSGMIVGQEMALGFTSDIAKNNLGESFYRRPLLNFICRRIQESQSGLAQFGNSL